MNKWIFLEIDECLSQPCANNGTCTDLENGFLCQCLPEWNGTLCTEAKSILKERERKNIIYCVCDRQIHVNHRLVDQLGNALQRIKYKFPIIVNALTDKIRCLNALIRVNEFQKEKQKEREKNISQIHVYRIHAVQVNVK